MDWTFYAALAMAAAGIAVRRRYGPVARSLGRRLVGEGVAAMIVRAVCVGTLVGWIAVWLATGGDGSWEGFHLKGLIE